MSIAPFVAQPAPGFILSIGKRASCWVRSKAAVVAAPFLTYGGAGVLSAGVRRRFHLRGLPPYSLSFMSRFVLELRTVSRLPKDRVFQSPEPIPKVARSLV